MADGNIEFINVDVESWTPPNHFPDLRTRGTIAWDLETKDPNLRKYGPGWPRKDGEIIGVAVAAEGFSGYYPIAHEGGGNMDRRQVLGWLQDQLDTPHITKVAHNAQYDLGWLKAEGVRVSGPIVDTMMGASLLDENRMSYSLNSVCYDWLNKTKSEKLLKEAAKQFGVDPKAEMYKLPAMYVGPYAEQDAVLCLELWHYIRTQMQNQNLGNIFDLEMQLVPMLVDMTYRGVRVNLDKADAAKKGVTARLEKIQAEAGKMAGKDISFWAAKDLAEACDKIGIEYPYTRTIEEAEESGKPRNPSFTASFLKSSSHPFLKAVLEGRKLSKVSGTFLDGLIDHSHEGRIHAHINQLRSDDGGTVSGRLSMNNPNLQQIPARDPELGPLIRGLFEPEEGCEWVCMDYSQQEPRLTVHFADALGRYQGRPLRGVEEMLKFYRQDPNADFHEMVAEMVGIPRKPAKAIGLGTIYGMGKGKLAKELDITFEEAKALYNTFHRKVPFIKELAGAVSDKLDAPGSGGRLRSLEGRVCRFEKWEPVTFGTFKALPLDEAVKEYGAHTRLKRAYTYKALNRLIQASAADMTKRAMLNLYRAGHLPMLQVHDDLNFSIADRSKLKEIRDIMQDAVSIAVPIVVDTEIGPDWGHLEEVEVA